MFGWGSDALVGPRAAAWFAEHRKGGGDIMDRHLTAIRAIFGEDVDVRVTAPLGSASGEPRHVFIEIDLPIDDEAAQDLVEELQGHLLEAAGRMRSSTGNRWPLRNISVVLSGEPQDWDGVLKDIEELETSGEEVPPHPLRGELP